jgi:predicted permease
MRIQRWLDKVFRRDTAERELSEELQFHLEKQIDQNIANGMTPSDARYAAIRAIGGVERRKEQVRDAWRVNFVDGLVQDLRYAGRMLRRSPGFTAVAVFSLAAGIGANTAVFSVINPLFLERLPVPHPEQLVSLGAMRPDLRMLMPFLPSSISKINNTGMTYREFEQLRESDAFSGAFASGTTLRGARMIPGNEDTGEGGEEVRVEPVSGMFFSTLQIGAALGRVLSEDDDRDGAAPAAVLSYGFWRRRFGQDPQVVGKTITLLTPAAGRGDAINRKLVTIVGIAASGFSGLDIGAPRDFWIPMQGKATGRDPMDYPWWNKGLVMARLRSGTSLKEAEAKTGALYRRTLEAWTAEYGATWTSAQRDAFVGQRLLLETGATGTTALRNQYRQGLLVLMVAVGSVLLIACANIAALSLARGAARQKELALRLAIGSGRFRLVRQLLTESMMVAVFGGMVGLAVAYGGVRLLFTYAPALAVLNTNLNLRVLGFTLATSLISAVVVGLIPALRSTKLELNPTLKNGYGNWAGTRSRLALNNLVVVSQIAIAMVLVVGAGLFVRTLFNLRNLDTGFEKNGIVVLNLDRSLEWNRLSELFARIETIPAVQSVTCWDSGLLTGGFSQVGPIVVGGPSAQAGHGLDDQYSLATIVGPRFFQTMGISVIAGRDFLSEDANRRVAVISETMAKYFFGGANPIGKSFRPDPNPRAPETEIIGVAEDVKYASLREEPQRIIYYPLSSGIWFNPRITKLAIRTSADISAVSGPVRGVIQDFDRQLQITSVLRMDEILDSKLVQEQFMARMAGFFSLLALFLACVGLYGTLSHAVAQRTKEMGVRIAVGAGIPNVIGLVMFETSRIVGIGVLIGLGAALAATRAVSGLLFGLTPTDPWTLAGAALLLLMAAAVAAYLPARRAGRVDPLVALRHE